MEPQADTGSPDLEQRMRYEAEARFGAAMPVTAKDDKYEEGGFELQVPLQPMQMEQDDDAEFKFPESLPMMVTIRIGIDPIPPPIASKTASKPLSKPEPRMKSGSAGQSGLARSSVDKHAENASQGKADSRANAALRDKALQVAARSELANHESPPPARPTAVSGEHSRAMPPSQTAGPVGGPPASDRGDIPSRPRAVTRPAESANGLSHDSWHAAEASVHGRSSPPSATPTSTVTPTPTATPSPIAIPRREPGRETPKHDPGELPTAVAERAMPHEAAPRPHMEPAPASPSSDMSRHAHASTRQLPTPDANTNTNTNTQANTSTPLAQADLTYQFRSLGPQATVNLRFDTATSDAIVFATPSNDQVRHLIDAGMRENATPLSTLQFQDRQREGNPQRQRQAFSEEQTEDQETA
jgi:hypothetical protein